MALLDKERDQELRREGIEEEKALKHQQHQAALEVKNYKRQLQLARNNRKDEYRREAVSEKLKLEAQRTTDLRGERSGLLTRTRMARSQGAITRQAFVDSIERMQQTHTLEITQELKDAIENPEIHELFGRVQGSASTGKIPISSMREVYTQMLREGKLQPKASLPKAAKSPPRPLRPVTAPTRAVRPISGAASMGSLRPVPSDR